MTRPRFAALALAVCLSLTGCGNPSAVTPNPINTGATITRNLAKGVRLVEDGIRSANASGVASNEVTASVLRLTMRINKAGLDADTVLREQATNPNASVKTIIAPLVAAIQMAIDQDVIKITDPTVRDTVSSSLSALILTINGILAALGQTAEIGPYCWAGRDAFGQEIYVPCHPSHVEPAFGTLTSEVR